MSFSTNKDAGEWTDDLMVQVAAPGPIGGASFAIPTGVRAITLMHIRHGQARWEMLVAPAERYARSGVPVSRALSRDLQVGATSLGADAEARRVFGRGTGTAVTEGDIWAPLDLASTLGVLRPMFGSGASFLQRYTDYDGLPRNLSELHHRLSGAVMIRRTRDQVLTLPEKTRRLATAAMSALHQRQYKAAEENLVAFLRGHRGNASPAASLPAQERWNLGAIIFTSGTTGPSKGVMMSNAQFYFASDQCVSQTRLTENDVYMTANPLFHGNAQFLTTYPSLIAGASMVLYEKFSPTRFAQRVVPLG